MYPQMSMENGSSYPNLVPMGLSNPVPASAPATGAPSGDAISAIPMSYIPSNAPKAQKIAITSPQQLVAQLCKMGFSHEEATQAAAVESTIDAASEWILAYRVSKQGFSDETGSGSSFPKELDPEVDSLKERLTTFYALVPEGGAVSGLDSDKITHIASYYKGREANLNTRLREKYGFDLHSMDFADTSDFEPAEPRGLPLPSLNQMTVFVRSATLNAEKKHVYTVAVLGPDNEPKEVQKRYSEFDALRIAVRSDCKECQAKLDAVPFPRKTMNVMGGPVSDTVAEKRREELENWLQGLFALEALCNIQIPENFSAAVPHISTEGEAAGAAAAVAKVQRFIGSLEEEQKGASTKTEGGSDSAHQKESWGSWLTKNTVGGNASSEAGDEQKSAAAAATITPVSCRVSCETLSVEVPAGPLGLVLEEREGKAGEVCPRVFLSDLKPVDGRTNALQGLVPVGANLLVIDGKDTTVCSLQETTDHFVNATSRARRLGFQVVHYKPDSSGRSGRYETACASNGGNTSAIRHCYEFVVVAPSGDLGLVLAERKESAGFPKVFLKGLTMVDGKDNPLTAKIPIGSCLVSICGEDVSNSGMSEVGEVLGSMRHCEREVVFRMYA